MKMKHVLLSATAFVLIVFTSFNETKAQLTRPSPIIGAYTLNAFVGNSFDLYYNTNAIKTRVDAVQTEIANKAALDINVDKVLTELSDCGSLLTNLLPNVSNLIASSADIPTKVKDELASKPLRIPGALIQIKNSVKAVKESQENITTMLKTIIPGIKAKLKEKTGADTTQKTGTLNNTPVLTPQQPNATTEMATTLIIDNIAYGDVQTFMDTLKSNTNIKTINKTFGSNRATFTISHTRTTDDLLDFITKSSYGKKTDVIELNSEQIKLKMK